MSQIINPNNTYQTNTTNNQKTRNITLQQYIPKTYKKIPSPRRQQQTPHPKQNQPLETYASALARDQIQYSDMVFPTTENDRPDGSQLPEYIQFVEPVLENRQAIRDIYDKGPILDFDKIGKLIAGKYYRERTASYRVTATIPTSELQNLSHTDICRNIIISNNQNQTTLTPTLANKQILAVGRTNINRLTITVDSKEEQQRLAQGFMVFGKFKYPLNIESDIQDNYYFDIITSSLSDIEFTKLTKGLIMIGYQPIQIHPHAIMHQTLPSSRIRAYSRFCYPPACIKLEDGSFPDQLELDGRLFPISFPGAPFKYSRELYNEPTKKQLQLTPILTKTTNFQMKQLQQTMTQPIKTTTTQHSDPEDQFEDCEEAQDMDASTDPATTPPIQPTIIIPPKNQTRAASPIKSPKKRLLTKNTTPRTTRSKTKQTHNTEQTTTKIQIKNPNGGWLETNITHDIPTKNINEAFEDTEYQISALPNHNEALRINITNPGTPCTTPFLQERRSGQKLSKKKQCVNKISLLEQTQQSLDAWIAEQDTIQDKNEIKPEDILNQSDSARLFQAARTNHNNLTKLLKKLNTKQLQELAINHAGTRWLAEHHEKEHPTESNEDNSESQCLTTKEQFDILTQKHKDILNAQKQAQDYQPRLGRALFEILLATYGKQVHHNQLAISIIARTNAESYPTNPRLWNNQTLDKLAKSHFGHKIIQMASQLAKAPYFDSYLEYIQC